MTMEGMALQLKERRAQERAEIREAILATWPLRHANGRLWWVVRALVLEAQALEDVWAQAYPHEAKP